MATLLDLKVLEIYQLDPSVQLRQVFLNREKA